MSFLWILLGIGICLALAVLSICYMCFRMAFFAANNEEQTEEFPVPHGKIYKPHREAMINWMKEVRAMEHEEMSIRSFDGLTLRGKYYEYAPGAPIELMFHGYRGNGERDLCGGVQRCFALGRSALIVDQRACGGSEGHIISFGINESRDCHDWIDFMLRRFGPDVKIILTGISMGAATVVMAAGKPLPKNVIGVLADCGYTSARDMIKKTIREMKLPVELSYPFVKLGARIFGHFDLEANCPLFAAGRCTVPTIFIHGEADEFVPCDMSRMNHDACTAKKALLTVPDAGHGLSYPVAPEAYLKALRDFFGPEASHPDFRFEL
ncbi:MAG: alpha/beta hydrolase [Oscillospiraceae bacterium]|nr:alpha/beta hydrolase [Oscillospiraceae bacterium]